MRAPILVVYHVDTNSIRTQTPMRHRAYNIFSASSHRKPTLRSAKEERKLHMRFHRANIEVLEEQKREEQEHSIFRSPLVMECACDGRMWFDQKEHYQIQYSVIRFLRELKKEQEKIQCEWVGTILRIRIPLRSCEECHRCIGRLSRVERVDRSMEQPWFGKIRVCVCVGVHYCECDSVFVIVFVKLARISWGERSVEEESVTVQVVFTSVEFCMNYDSRSSIKMMSRRRARHGMHCDASSAAQICRLFMGSVNEP